MLHREMLINGVFVGGECDQAVGKTIIRSPWDGSIVGTAAEGGYAELRTCIDAAHDAFLTWRRSPRHQRQALLRRIAALSRERTEELAELMAREIGKPITWGRAEVARLALTFDYAADALATWGVSSLPLDMDPRGSDYRATVERFPIGVIFAIVPYNWPYNLTAHKIAPALASGNTIVVKPSPLAPLSTLSLVRLIHEAGCPPGVVNAWCGEPIHAEKALVEDSRVKMLSFTGSPAVGWKLKSLLPEKKVVLELGGNATAIVDQGAGLLWAANRISAGAYGYAGQVCIAVQHVLAHESVYDSLRKQLIRNTETCPAGDPCDEKTVCGPMISDEAAERVSGLLQFGKVIAGGGRDGRLLKPTLLEDVDPESPLAKEEAFGPVLTLRRFSSYDEAFQIVNASQYGIHCGVFTHFVPTVERAFRELDVAGVVINDYPTLRFDNLPYGGVRRSGFGREGVMNAMEEMTDQKTLVVRTT